MKKKLIMVQLNEFNFDLIKKYFKKKKLPNLKNISNNLIKTTSENKYHLLEPWIQWYSIYTGLRAEKHKVFRLGDVEKFKFNHKQIFEIIEKKGFSVGCISPMNSKNNLKNPKYFISDPWTKTKNSNNFFLKLTSETLSEFVNNNSSSIISKKNYFYLILIFLKFVRIKKYLLFLIYILNSKEKHWNKSIIFDLLIHEIHLNLLKKTEPNFSTIFFNASAHIQHHYLFNSIKFKKKNERNPDWYLSLKSDPFADIGKAYDLILEDYLNLLNNKKYDLIICTGLSQQPNNKKEFYYRLSEHSKFMKEIGIEFANIYPRMSRDFLIEFKKIKHLNFAYEILSKIKLNNKSFFKIFEKKGRTLFISLIYSSEIKDSDYLITKGKKIYLKNKVSFVAIKNGKHCSKGYLYLSNFANKNKKNLYKSINIIKIFDFIIDYFSKSTVRIKN